MSSNALKTNQDLFTEAEVDFEKTLGRLLYLDLREVPEYQNIVLNSETGEVLPSVLIDETTGRIVEGSVPEGVQAEVRSRPIEGTLVAYDLILEAEGFGNQIEVTVPATIKPEGLVYNKAVKLTGLSARHWSRTTRQVNGGRVNFLHSQGFKLRAEGIQELKTTSKATAEK